MKKITLKAILFLTFALTSAIGSSQVFYYEDFRYDTGARGFTKLVVENDGQADTNLGKRVGDIPDADDSNPEFTGRSATRIPNGGATDQRAISFQLSQAGDEITDLNFDAEAWAMLTSQDFSAINGPKITLWTQQRFATGDVSSLHILVSENYTSGLPSTATWTDETANITGEFATSGLNDQVYVSGALDLSAYTGSNVTIAFKAIGGSTTYDSATSANGTYYVSDVVFEATPLQVAVGSITLNVDSSLQTDIFDEPYAASGNNNTNFNPRNFDRLFTTESYATRFISGQEIPVNEGATFKVNDIYDPIILSEVKYSIRNAAKDGVNPTEWKVEASNDGENWTDVGGGAFTPIQDGSNPTGEQTKVVNTSDVAYRYYRLVLATTLAAEDNTGFIDIQEVNFTVIEASLSTNDIQKTEAKITAYPNPTHSVINISKAAGIEVTQVRLVDLTGKTVYVNNTAQPIDVSQLAKGMYILQISSSNAKQSSTKVVVN